MRHVVNLLILFSFITLKCNAGENEYIDLTSFIDTRTQQYNITPYHRIFVCSPYRTGSTYVFNILRFLFEDDQTKSSPNWGAVFPGRVVCKCHSLNYLSQNATYVALYTTKNSFIESLLLILVVQSTLEGINAGQ